MKRNIHPPIHETIQESKSQQPQTQINENKIYIK